MIWKIIVESYECPDKFLSETHVVCGNENSESKYCQEETCPRKISLKQEDKRQEMKL